LETNLITGELLEIICVSCNTENLCFV